MADETDLTRAHPTMAQHTQAPKLTIEPPAEYHVRHPDQHPEWHEHSDVRIKPLVITLVSLVTVLVVTIVGLFLLFRTYETQENSKQRKQTAVIDAQPIVPPQGVPRLQGIPGYSTSNPKRDMDAQRSLDAQQLKGYGVSHDGHARIPVERAIDLALERGVFKTATPRNASATTTKVESASSSNDEKQKQE